MRIFVRKVFQNETTVGKENNFQNDILLIFVLSQRTSINEILEATRTYEPGVMMMLVGFGSKWQKHFSASCLSNSCMMTALARLISSTVGIDCMMLSETIKTKKKSWSFHRTLHCSQIHSRFADEIHKKRLSLSHRKALAHIEDIFFWEVWI